MSVRTKIGFLVFFFILKKIFIAASLVIDMSDTVDLGYMVEKLGIEQSKIHDLSNFLYKHYGTTMAGLRV